MARFDRYLLSQLLALFGFFSLVLVFIYWINRAVGLFDRLISDGQSTLVFLEISALTLPNVIRIVLPVSAFAASVYVTNRLTQDGELVVMQATGFSAFRLARPVFYFGAGVSLMLLVLANFIVPHSRLILAERTAEISANVTSQLLVDGHFMHPADGITFYIREISSKGELYDVFLADNRAAESRTIYTARRALLVRDDQAPKLLMFEGLSQTLNRGTKRLSVIHFDDFTYDMGSVLAPAAVQKPGLEEMTTPDLLRAFPAGAEVSARKISTYLTEVHSRFAQPLLALATAMIGFATLLLGAFSRFGLWRQIIGAIVLLVVIQMINNAAISAAARSAWGWPLIYLAPLLGLGLSAALLWTAQRPRRKHRDAAGRAAA